jgi:hypothetical protein
MRELERCDREIAEVERLLRAGHRDVEGLCRALIDWNVERRILLGSYAVEKPVQTVEGGLLSLPAVKDEAARLLLRELGARPRWMA